MSIRGFRWASICKGISKWVYTGATKLSIIYCYTGGGQTCIFMSDCHLLFQMIANKLSNFFHKVNIENLVIFLYLMSAKKVDDARRVFACTWRGASR